MVFEDQSQTFPYLLKEVIFHQWDRLSVLFRMDRETWIMLSFRSNEWILNAFYLAGAWTKVLWCECSEYLKCDARFTETKRQYYNEKCFKCITQTSILANANSTYYVPVTFVSKKRINCKALFISVKLVMNDKKNLNILALKNIVQKDRNKNEKNTQIVTTKILCRNVNSDLAHSDYCSLSNRSCSIC